MPLASLLLSKSRALTEGSLSGGTCTPESRGPACRTLPGYRRERNLGRGGGMKGRFSRGRTGSRDVSKPLTNEGPKVLEHVPVG